MSKMNSKGKSPKDEEKQNVQKLPFTTILLLLKIKIITY